MKVCGIFYRFGMGVATQKILLLLLLPIDFFIFYKYNIYVGIYKVKYTKYNEITI